MLIFGQDLLDTAQDWSRLVLFRGKAGMGIGSSIVKYGMNRHHFFAPSKTSKRDGV